MASWKETDIRSTDKQRDRLLKPLQIDGLGEVGVEAGFLARPDILVLSIAAKGNSLHLPVRPKPRHHLQPRPVRQSDVRDEQVERLGSCKPQGFPYCAGRR